MTWQGAGGAGGSQNNSTGAELQSLIAHKDVKVVSKDGTVTTSDQLLVDSKDGKNTLSCSGRRRRSWTRRTR